MKKVLPTLLACLACGLLAPAAGSGAESFQPQNLYVVGGEETWHAAPGFELRWSNPAGVAAVHYRVLSASGQTAVDETRVDWPTTATEFLRVPPIPGVYTAQVWLENTSGGLGPAASAKLRFDNVPPGRLEPQAVPGWIGRNAFPLAIRLGHPAGAEPLSGIRGYAFSIDDDPGGEPCAALLCEERETDLRGGLEDDTALLPGLPEGTSYLHAAAVSGSGVRSTTAAVALHVDETDPATTLSGAEPGWSNQPVRLLARSADSGSGMATSGGPLTPFTAIRVDGGSPIAASGDSVTTTVLGSGVHTVSYYARDAAGNVADGAIVNGRPNPSPQTAVVRVDREPPVVAFAATQDASDPEQIEATVRDSPSGFDPSRGKIEIRPAQSRQRFRALPTEARDGGLRARWDSSSYPPGPYEFRATAYDLAGNATSSTLRSNGSRMLLRGPLKARTTLLAGLDRGTVGCGRSARFGGRLLVGRHTPLAGKPVRVIERFADPRLGERVSTVRTGGDGRFATRLAPGPSREVIATAAPTPTLAGARSEPMRLEVRGGVGFHVSAPLAEVGGRPVVFDGRVSAPPFPAGGKTVELQFRLPGLQWSQFRTVRTDARGRFRYTYRFVDDDSRGARFQFRAFAPAQAGWPYLAAGSRPVTVRGR